ncbi:hypothetical protein GCM10023200_52080 [Actinomycetospora chlora]|uniref:Uncharacterized protein n=2 Tax=Actinomycetospora chlora TaxID=663608 RepID=A0ABP9CHT1_9PSEU
MVPLKQYRPDVPYAMVTAEHARVRVVARESIEDSVYHLCPHIAGAWRTIYDSPTSPRVAYPSLARLEEAGRAWALNADLTGLPELLADLRNSGTIL